MKTFTLNSGSIRFGDPSIKDNKDSLVVRAKSGKWNCDIKKEENYKNFTIVKFSAEIEEEVDDYAKAMSMILGRSETLIQEEHLIKIDSGVAGFFDNNYFMIDHIMQEVERKTDIKICEENPFYSICCDRALSEEGWGEIPHGCVCSVSSDGIYKIKTFKNNSGNVVKIVANLVPEKID